MKILKVFAENFASYKTLELDFSNQGRTLIQGANGSGKSTLCDVIPWAMYGKTAKDGIADEVLSWPGNDVCKVTLYLENVTIHRSRGPYPKDNDLYWVERANREKRRGKDLQDTQKLINGILGADYSLYLAGSYYHEFSQTAQFFTTTAKNRRAICEQLVDLSLPIKLQDGISADTKLHNKSLAKLDYEQSQLKSNIELLKRLELAENQKAGLWEKNRQSTKEFTMKSYERFEKNRDSVVHNQCIECGTKFSEPKHIHDDSPNPYTEKLKELEIAVNPHSNTTKDYSNEITELNHKSNNLENEVQGLNTIIGDLSALQQITEDMRSTTIRNTIKYIESETNKSLTDYFDAEIRVEFDVANADKLEVTIHKDGNLCSFTQLSKGQRCLLKLCFGTAVMQAVQNHHGISFNSVFYDESLDGLSDAFKIKAYRLFESLQYENTFVVEHSEALKACFSNAYTVELTDRGSVLAKT